MIEALAILCLALMGFAAFMAIGYGGEKNDAVMALLGVLLAGMVAGFVGFEIFNHIHYFVTGRTLA